ncbi:MAG: hypothetical protein KR126chlam3_00618 [Chlamydiae bacterium]|nr:hypothetical protein [Chlamydiota bacterium]
MSFSYATNPIVSPAYYAENHAFHPASQPKNTIQREVLARVVAIAAPFFFCYQVCVHAITAPVDLLLALIGLSSGSYGLCAIGSCIISIKCLFSSIIEMPQKLVFGPKNAPNYFGPSDRYNMQHHRFATVS